MEQQGRLVQHIVVDNQVYEQDYEDGLAPGYRFCPTDWELIVYYLKAKIERDEHPPCRIHQVNIYDYTPNDLAKKYRSCDDNMTWYFFTPRERQCLNGSRPKRRVAGNLGTWKAAQSDSPVRDVKGKEVGRKRSLFFLDHGNGNSKGDMKTTHEWLMHEYTTEHPDLPVGTGPQTMLSNCVLCKIYKKETKENKRNNQGKAKLQVVGGVMSSNNDERPLEEEEIIISNQISDNEQQPSPAKRTRLLSSDDDDNQLQGASTSVQYDRHQSTTDVYYYQQNHDQHLSATSVSVSDYGASTSKYDHQAMADVYFQQNHHHQHMSVITATNNNNSSSVRVSDGASKTSTPNDLPPASSPDEQTPSSNITTPPSSAEEETSLPPLDISDWDDPWLNDPFNMPHGFWSPHDDLDFDQLLLDDDAQLPDIDFGLLN